MRHLLYCDTVGRIGSAGLLLLRVVMGIAFLFHGWPKIQNPLGWMGPESPVPAIFQALAALAEFGGGMALIVGLLIDHARRAWVWLAPQSGAKTWGKPRWGLLGVNG